jgi:catechol 2,3-dioxygenase-like lactoylglutathione lyase family enzyme
LTTGLAFAIVQAMKRPILTQQVTFLHTADLTKTAEFYENSLGLPLVLDQGICRIYASGGDAYLGFCQHLDPPSDPTGIIITLVSPEVDAWYAYLQAQGIEFEKPPHYNSRYNIYHCFLHDPNGYLLEIQRFEDPAWPGQSSVNGER